MLKSLYNIKPAFAIVNCNSYVDTALRAVYNIRIAVLPAPSAGAARILFAAENQNQKQKLKNTQKGR